MAANAPIIAAAADLESTLAAMPKAAQR